MRDGLFFRGKDLSSRAQIGSLTIIELNLPPIHLPEVLVRGYVTSALRFVRITASDVYK